MNRKNYQLELDKILSGISPGDPPKKLLLHSCCGPCSTYVLEYLSPYFEIYLYYYNPNLSSEEEYARRLETQKTVLEKMEFLHPVTLVEGLYKPEEFTNITIGLEDAPEGGSRCALCFHLRLAAAAAAAAALACPLFCTTLTVSPHKNAELINSIGQKLSALQGIEFLPSDFKKRGGYARSIELSRSLGLYRQDFCGCTYSQCPL